MAGCDRFNAMGVFDEAEPPFTEEEIQRAFDLRQRVSPDMEVTRRLGRYDRCPHQPKCERLTDCVEAIAWYLRHQAVIELRLAQR